MNYPPGRQVIELPLATSVEDEDVIYVRQDTVYSRQATIEQVLEPCLRKDEPLILDNEEWLQAKNNTGLGVTNLIRYSAANEIEIGNGIVLKSDRTLNVRGFEAPGFICNSLTDLSSVTSYLDPAFKNTLAVIAGTDLIGMALDNVGAPNTNENDPTIFWGDDVDDTLHFKFISSGATPATKASLGVNGDYSIIGSFYLGGNRIYNRQSDQSFVQALRFQDNLVDCNKNGFRVNSDNPGTVSLSVRNNSADGNASSRLILEGVGNGGTYVTSQEIGGGSAWSFGGYASGGVNYFGIARGTNFSANIKLEIAPDAQKLLLENGDISYGGESLLKGGNDSLLSGTVGDTTSTGGGPYSTDIFPPAGKTMSQLLGGMTGLAEIWFTSGPASNNVNADDQINAGYELLSDRIRVHHTWTDLFGSTPVYTSIKVNYIFFFS